MDSEASTEKAVSLTMQAGEKGAKIVVFPEAFIPGYQGDSLSAQK